MLIWSRTLKVATSLASHMPTISNRELHANRAAICRIKRPKNEYCRQYPVTIVFQDGSTITSRHQVPREIIKLPLTLESCKSEAERKAWQGRRKPKEVIEIKKDDTDVAYNQMAYLKAMQTKRGAAGVKAKK